MIQQLKCKLNMANCDTIMHLQFLASTFYIAKTSQLVEHSTTNLIRKLVANLMVKRLYTTAKVAPGNIAAWALYTTAKVAPGNIAAWALDYRTWAELGSHNAGLGCAWEPQCRGER